MGIDNYIYELYIRASLVVQRVKHLPAMPETRGRSLGGEDPLEKETAPHSSILAWKTPWTDKLGRLQSMESQRVRHIWLCMHTHTFMDIDNYIYELYITIQNLRAFILKRNGKKKTL